MGNFRERSSVIVASALAVLLLSGCANRDVSPTAVTAEPNLSLARQVSDIAVELPRELAADTIVSFGGMVQLSATAVDAGGRAVPGVAVRWTSGDTSVAEIGNDGALRIRRSGVVRLTAAAGRVAQVRGFQAILVDADAVREVLEDPFVARLVSGLSPTVGARVQSALAASAEALNARAAPMLRTLGVSVAVALRGADDPADRAVMVVLDLYVHQLEQALTLSSES